jgi:hypothetical protein
VKSTAGISHIRPPGRAMFPGMCGRARLSSDVSEIKLVFSIPPNRPTSNFPPSWKGSAFQARGVRRARRAQRREVLSRLEAVAQQIP